jgi:transposase
MTHIAGFGRGQPLLLPEAIDDYVEADNSVRFIDAFVDGSFGRRVRAVEAKATGRPGYAPDDLLKLYIYDHRPPQSQTKRGQELRRQSPLFCAFSSLSRNANASLADCSVTSGS